MQRQQTNGEQGNPIRAEQQFAHAHTPARASIDFDLEFDLIDRVQSSKPETKPPEHLAAVRSWIESYYRKHHHEHGPIDDGLCAQMLTACNDRPDLVEWLFRELIASQRAPGHSNGWLLTVAIQRIQRIDAKRQAAVREKLKQRRRPPGSTKSPLCAAAAAAANGGGLQAAGPMIDSILKGRL